MSYFFKIFSLILTVTLWSSAGDAVFKTKEDLDKSLIKNAQDAMKIVDDWRGEMAQQGERTLKIVYWSPQDRQAQPGFEKRLSDIFLDIQKFYAAEMDRNGFGKLTFQLEKNAEGLVKVYEAKGKHPYKHYNVKSGDEILKDVTEELDKHNITAKNETVVIFCNMANWDAQKKTINQNSPYYARGSAANGVAWQVDSAILNLDDLTNMKDRVKDGQYGDITRGKYNTIFIGGVAHELGHAFGLPHNLERHDEHQAYGIALMGSGNRAYGNERRKDGLPAVLTHASALRLATHPMFSGITKDLHSSVRFGYKGLKFVRDEGNGVMVKGEVVSNIPCYTLVAFVDPDGGGDYDATTHVCVPDSNGNFTIQCPARAFRKKGKYTKGRIRIVSYFANGLCSSNNVAIKRHSLPYSFDQNNSLQFGKISY